ncbi:MAG: class B sortase, partial [Clostridiaceae bacterium]
GHALMDGSMFGSLWEYENPNYYTRHPDIQLFMPDGTQKTLQVFACSRVDGTRTNMPIAFSSESEFLSFIDSLAQVSAFTSNVKITANDRIVSFCVVLPDGGEGRLLVSCKLADGSAVTALDETIAPETPVETTQAPEESPQG